MAVEHELVVPLAPALATLLRTKASLPHQLNPPLSWAALDYLAAIWFGERLWFSDGENLWRDDGDVWRFAEAPGIAELVTRHAWPNEEPFRALPRAFPLGALGDGTMLWGLRWYDTDHYYVFTPVVLDPSRRHARVLAAEDGVRIGGTQPAQLRATGAPHTVLITGTFDAGAAAHIDEFIMVPIAYSVDLVRGTYRRTDDAGSVGRLLGGLTAVGKSQTVTAAGLSYSGHVALGEHDVKGLFAVTVDTRVLILDLRVPERATCRLVDRARMGRLIAEPLDTASPPPTPAQRSREAPRHPEQVAEQGVSASTAIAWALHADDNFDRESATHIDARGLDRVEGLVELWRRVLSEGIVDSGSRTFTDFSLHWHRGSTDAGVQPFKNHELARMRAWVYGSPGPFEVGGARDRTTLLARETAPLLRAIAEAHERLLATAGTPYAYGHAPTSPAGKIRSAAATSASALELQVKLATLV